MACYHSWADWKVKRLLESKGQQPNYSFDMWLKRSKDLGDEISSFVGDAKQKDQELDKKKKSPAPEKEDDDEKDKKRQAWDKLKDVAKERDQKSEEDSKKSSSFSIKSGKQRPSTSK